MRITRIAAIILCIAVLLPAAGCTQQSAEVSETPPTTPSAPSAEPTPGIDYDGALAAFSPDTVMITTGDYTVTWEELYFFICSNIGALESSIGEIKDWSEQVYDGKTYAEIILEYSSENTMMYKGVKFGANELGVQLSEEDYEILREEYEATIAEYGGEDEFLTMLRDDSGITSKELYDYLVETSYLAGLCFTAMYGENGTGLSDEDAEEYTKDDGYFMAKHILRLKPEENTEEEGEASEDTETTDPYAESEDILKKLDSYTGDDIGGYFDELMHEYSEDGGLQSFPDGYLFQYGDMVTEFYESCAGLDVGTYSGIVETTYGYHIIYRLPIDYDATPYAYYRQYDFSTLRNIAALGMFDAAIYGWIDSFVPEYSVEYESIDFAELFKINIVEEPEGESGNDSESDGDDSMGSPEESAAG